jgi:hypothetical protein
LAERRPEVIIVEVLMTGQCVVARKTYSPPRLVRYGTLTEITHANDKAGQFDGAKQGTEKT